MAISKRDLFTMTPEQRIAGLKMWRKTHQSGHLAMSSEDFEKTAVKTWIRYVNSKGEENAVIECEIFASADSSGCAVGVLCGMCPKCGECFLVNEGNKTMHIGYVEYRRAPGWLRVHWEHQQRGLGRIVTDSDRIPLVSSPERWVCDYCKSWCVKVTDCIACDDYRGATVAYLSFPRSSQTTERPQAQESSDEATYEV